mgnify:FL=1
MVWKRIFQSLISLSVVSGLAYSASPSTGTRARRANDETASCICFSDDQSSYMKGGYGSFTIRAKGISGISSLGMDILYEKDVISGDSVSTYLSSDSSSMFDYKIDNDNGVVHATYIFDSDKKFEDENLFYFNFHVLDTVKKNSYFSLAVTSAADEKKEEVSVSGDFSYFSLKENTGPSESYCSIYSSIDKSSLNQNDIVEFSYSSYDFYSIGAGSFVLSYDKDAFEFFSFEKGDFLSKSGMTVMVNSDLSGSVRVDFAYQDMDTSYNYSLFKVKFKTKANVNRSFGFTLKSSGLSGVDGKTKYKASDVTNNVNVVYKQDVSLLPSLYLKSKQSNGKVYVTLSLEKDSHLSAADIDVSFDNSYLTYVSCKNLVSGPIGSIEPIVGFNETKVKEGNLHISWLYQADLVDAIDIASMEFDSKEVEKDVTTYVDVKSSGTRNKNIDRISLHDQGVSVKILSSYSFFGEDKIKRSLRFRYLKTKEDDAYTYSSFDSMQLQFKYTFDSKNHSDIDETGIFVTDDTSFTFSDGVYNSSTLRSGLKDGKHGYASINQNRKPEYVLGINLSEDQYSLSFKAAGYVVVDGMYYFSSPSQETSVVSLVDEYHDSEFISGETEKIIDSLYDSLKGTNL